MNQQVGTAPATLLKLLFPRPMPHFPMQCTFLSLYLTWSCCSIQQHWVLFFLRYYLPWFKWLLFPVAPLPSRSNHLLHWLLSLDISLECQYFLRYLSNTPFHGFNHYLVFILPISIYPAQILLLSSDPYKQGCLQDIALHWAIGTSHLECTKGNHLLKNLLQLQLTPISLIHIILITVA